TVELELNPHALPTIVPAVNASLGLAVRKCRLDCFDDQPQFRAYHAEQIDHALFIDRCVPEAAEVDRRSEDQPIAFRPFGARCGRYSGSGWDDFVPRLDLDHFVERGIWMFGRQPLAVAANQPV